MPFVLNEKERKVLEALQLYKSDGLCTHDLVRICGMELQTVNLMLLDLERNEYVSSGLRKTEYGFERFYFYVKGFEGVE